MARNSWHNEGHGFANQFLRKIGNNLWMGITWIQEPSSMITAQDGSMINRPLEDLPVLFDIFENEVKVMKGVVEKLFGKVKMIKAGSPSNRSVVFMIPEDFEESELINKWSEFDGVNLKMEVQRLIKQENQNKEFWNNI
tara:strand:- start:80 stop:496 length:417 start_codon:yes stop_codon:yes gene_type:complete